jgi:hypothetical protein
MKTPKTQKAQTAPSEPSTKLQTLTALLSRAGGAGINELMAATGVQAHSVRGALAGSLKKKGFQVRSAKADGRRVYRIVAGEAR